jgi:hypothetical protein
MKKDIKAWAIKLRGRSFYQDAKGAPVLYKTLSDASSSALRIRTWQEIKAEPIRVRVRIEEIE